MKALAILMLLCAPALAQSDAVRSQAKQYLFAWYDDEIELELLKQSIVREATQDVFNMDQSGGDDGTPAIVPKPILDPAHQESASRLLRSLFDPSIRLNCAFRGRVCEDQWTAWWETFAEWDGTPIKWTFYDVNGRAFHIRKLFNNEAILSGFSVGRQCHKIEVDEAQDVQIAACRAITKRLEDRAWKPW